MIRVISLLLIFARSRSWNGQFLYEHALMVSNEALPTLHILLPHGLLYLAMRKCRCPSYKFSQIR